MLSDLEDDAVEYKHGQRIACPCCGTWGRYDDMVLGPNRNEVEFDNSVWFNEKAGYWECFDCWLK